MADTQETIADIAAEKRRMAEHIRENLSTVPVRRMDQEAEIKSLEDEADRLEAAHKRERESADAKIADLQSRVKLWTDRSAELVKKCDELYANARRRELPKNTSKNGADFGQLGDAAKLRKALVTIAELTTPCEGVTSIELQVQGEAVTALAAPPRNCDRPECATTKAAQDVWRREDGGKTAYYEWLLATATEKEGGNK